MEPTYFVRHPDGSHSVADPQPISNAPIKKMVDRFLGWKLPSDFAPDAGITFKPNANPDSSIELQYKHEPVGTNLFTADQAKAMFEYCVDEDYQPIRKTL